MKNWDTPKSNTLIYYIKAQQYNTITVRTFLETKRDCFDDIFLMDIFCISDTLFCAVQW
jgi:hypothetical protein